MWAGVSLVLCLSIAYLGSCFIPSDDMSAFIRDRRYVSSSHGKQPLVGLNQPPNAYPGIISNGNPSFPQPVNPGFPQPTNVNQAFPQPTNVNPGLSRPPNVSPGFPSLPNNNHVLTRPNPRPELILPPNVTPGWSRPSNANAGYPQATNVRPPQFGNHNVIRPGITKPGPIIRNTCTGVPRGSPHWIPGLDQWCPENCPSGNCPKHLCVCY